MVEFLPSALSRSGISFIVGIITIMVTIFIIIRDGFRKKAAVLLNFVQISNMPMICTLNCLFRLYILQCIYSIFSPKLTFKS